MTQTLQRLISNRADAPDDSALIPSAEDKVKRAEIRKRRDEKGKEVRDALSAAASGRSETTLREIKALRGPNWLSDEPTHRGGSSMAPLEWRAVVCLLLGLEEAIPVPATCPSCGGLNSVPHSLSCGSGSSIWNRHEEPKYELMRCMQDAHFWVVKARNPRIEGRDPTEEEEQSEPRLFGDIKVRGLAFRNRMTHLL